MNITDWNTALYEKMAAEQEEFRDWLKSQPSEEVLNHAYEYTVREDILMEMEQLELTISQSKALLISPSPLADVYRYFEKLETDHMDVVRDSIENRADGLVEQQAELMKKANELIDHFCWVEYGSPADYNNLKEIGIAYTTIFEDKIPLQVNVDLVNLRIERYLDNHLMDCFQYSSLQQMISEGLEHLNFQDLTYISDEALEAIRSSQKETNFSTQDVPMYFHSAAYASEHGETDAYWYFHSAAYASEHGETDAYWLSDQANFSCKVAIEQAISAHYRDNRLDTASAVQEILEEFGAERMNFILANTIQHKDADGRISRNNKAWAKTIPMPEDKESFRRNAYLVVDQVNPGLVDLFTRQARKTVQEKEKGSVLQKLKQELPAVQEVMEKFGPERMNFILANTIQHKDADGRISRDNKAWAKTIPMPEDKESFRRNAYLVVDQVNPGLVDLFARQARRAVQEKAKSSVLQKLKQELPAHKPAAPKKQGPER